MTDQSEPDHRRGTFRRAALFAGIPIVDLASLGPVAWLADGLESDGRLRLYFLPVAMLSKVFPEFGGAVIWYVAHFVPIG